MRFDGADLRGMPVEERVARGMSLVPEKRELFAEMTVEDNLELGAFPRCRGARARSTPTSRTSSRASRA